MKKVLAFDIGGSKLVVGVVDAAGNVLKSQKHMWDKLNERRVLDVVVQAGRQMRREFGHDVDGAGVSIPGLCDPEKGLWVESCFSGIANIAIRDVLSSELKLPVSIENDVNACALSEKMFGCCKDVEDFVWVTVSNGCGGAMYLRNELYSGSSGNAGEIGHVVVEEDNGFVCGCGNKGCLEIQAAGPGIERRYVAKTKKDTQVSAEDIAKRAREGEPAAIEVYRDEGVYLGRAIAAAVNLVNPRKIVIGGGVSASFDLFGKQLHETVMQRVYRTANKGLGIETTALGYNASLIGAASLALV